MKVPGSAPGQIVDLAESKERLRADEAKKTRRLAQQQSVDMVRKVTAVTPDPPDAEETRQSMERFLDWMAKASIFKKRQRHLARSSRVLKAYHEHNDPRPRPENEKGQKVSVVA